MGFLGDLFSPGDTETKTTIPKYAKNAVKPYAQDVQNFNYTPEFFGGQTYAPQSPFTNLAIQGMGNFSNQPSQDYWSSVMQGDYLGLNPAMQQAVMNPAMQATNAAFNQMGRFGSQANMENTAEAGMRALMPYYNAERDRMGQAAQFLPQLQSGQLQQQLGGGQLEESYAQRPIDEAMQRHQFGQDAGLRDLQARQGLLMPLFGNPSTTTQSVDGMSNLQGLLGLGMMGASMYGTGGFSNPFSGMGGGGGLSGMGVQLPTSAYTSAANPLGWMG